MPTLIELAEADLRTAETAAQKANEEAQSARRFLDQLKRLEARANELTPHLPFHIEVHPEINYDPKMTLAQLMENILQFQDHPLLMDDMIRELEKFGRVPGGKDPKANISSVLSKSPLFEFQKGRGWRLKQNAPSAETGEAS